MRKAALLSLFLAAAAHADTLLVANRGGSSITLIDPQSMEVLETIEVGPDPHEIAVSSDGRLAYVSNYDEAGGDTLSVVDVVRREKLRDVSIGPLIGPHGIVERQGKIWFTAEALSSVGRYDPTTDAVDWIGVSNQSIPHMLAISADADTVYTANIGSGSVSIIPVVGTESTSRKNIPTVAACEGIALSPDERELWVGSAQTGGIAIIDLATETVVARLSQGTFAYRVVFTPDGNHVLVPRAPNGVVVVYDARARTQIRTIGVGGTPLSVLPAADNRTMFVATTSPAQVLKVDFTTGTILDAVALEAPTPDGLAFAPTPHQKRRAVRH